MPKCLRIIAELVYQPDLSTFPEGTSLDEIAQQEMDHAPDLLYDSGDTVYRYEIVDDEKATAPTDARAPAPHAMIDQIEELLDELRRAL